MTPHQRKTSALAASLLTWFRRNARALPWRRTRDPYAIWVSEIMLQQTQVKTVIPYWERWIAALPDIPSLASASPDHLHKLWEGLGYYTRVRNLQKAAQQIVAAHAGQFPDRYEDVLKLPGIGRYTAGAICSIAFGQAHPVLDGNAIRVLARSFGIQSDTRTSATREHLWALARELVLAGFTDPGALNQALMELGATICTPSQPQCSTCPIRTLCYARNNDQAHLLPVIRTRTPASSRRFCAVVIVRNNRFLIRQRPEGVVNARLWEFPNVEVPTNTPKSVAQVPPFLNGLETEDAPWLTVRHTITRYRIVLEVFCARLPRNARPRGIWASPSQLQELAFSSAHRKIVSAVLSGAVGPLR